MNENVRDYAKVPYGVNLHYLFGHLFAPMSTFCIADTLKEMCATEDSTYFTEQVGKMGIFTEEEISFLVEGLIGLRDIKLDKNQKEAEYLYEIPRKKVGVVLDKYLKNTDSEVWFNSAGLLITRLLYELKDSSIKPEVFTKIEWNILLSGHNRADLPASQKLVDIIANARKKEK